MPDQNVLSLAQLSHSLLFLFVLLGTFSKTNLNLSQKNFTGLFGWATSRHLHVVNPFVQHCKKLYNVQLRYVSNTFYIVNEACVTIMWGCWKSFKYQTKLYNYYKLCTTSYICCIYSCISALRVENHHSDLSYMNNENHLF